MESEIPDAAIVHVAEAYLPENWNKKGYHDNVQRWGTAWLLGLPSLAMVVPSVASPDYNILINPSHPDFDSVEIIDRRPVTLDDRLI
ncbi:MAG: RES family NAD+ phosphorylase [Cyclobacteriaceae bacterium]